MQTLIICLGNLDLSPEKEKKILDIAKDSGQYQACLEAIVGVSTPALETNSEFSNTYLQVKEALV